MSRRQRLHVPGGTYYVVQRGSTTRPIFSQHQDYQLFERLLALRNDVGLLSEQWDVPTQRMTGNFPQAFSHVPLVNTARNLSALGGPGQRRSEERSSDARR